MRLRLPKMGCCWARGRGRWIGRRPPGWRLRRRAGGRRVGVEKAGGGIRGAVAASDAFFPFPDGPKLLLEAGVSAIIHPGGSVKDSETTDLINRMNGALVLTGQRHFKH